MTLSLEHSKTVGLGIWTLLRQLRRIASSVDYSEVAQMLAANYNEMWRVLGRILTARHVCAGVAGYALWRAIDALWVSPLRHVPGRFSYRLSSVFSLVDGITGSTNDDMVGDCERFGHVFVMEPRKVAVCHPDDGRLVLSSYGFAKDPLYSNSDVLEPSIFTTRDAELNKRRRRQVGPALSMAGLQRMEPTVLAAGVQQLMRKWDGYVVQAGGRAKVCYFYDVKLMTFDVIASLSLGHKHRSLTDGNRRTAGWVEKTFALMLAQMMVPAVKWWPLRGVAHLLLGRDIHEFLQFGYHTIQQRKADNAARMDHRPTDILQSFIDAEDPESKNKMTPSEVLTETITMILGGVDTTSAAITWALHLLLLYPEHMKLLLDQLRHAFRTDQLVTYEMAKTHAPYLEACVLESLRLCPTSTNLPRVVPKGGVTLSGGHHIPEGYTAVVSIAAAAMNPTVWPSPRLFDPTRFLGAGADANRRNVLTFSAGVRICPGRHLAMIEIVTTLANVLNRYNVELPADARHGPHNVDAAGLPVIMPRTNMVSMVPKYPARDCNIIISTRS
ncbi:hypothetical protein EV175_000379 [Coemansia sp. RSA 1933]|nr:hypothetical protein EV175_000379 [Coemansia sp. RSA 1933]